MRAIGKIRRRRSTALLVGAVALLPASCGSDDFKNEPRPAVAEDLTGVIQRDKVTISPRQTGAGPIVITISNQTEDSHTVTLEGESVRERVGPISPLDTATIQKTIEPGTYEVRAGSDVAVEREIAPATLIIGEKRPDSSDRLLLP